MSSPLSRTPNTFVALQLLQRSPTGLCVYVSVRVLAVLTSPVLRDTRLITALTYVEVQALSRASLYTVLDMFPDSAKMVQNAAVRMALKRTVILLKAHSDSQMQKDNAGNVLSEGTSRAYNMLTAAFQPTQGAADPSQDVGTIFRIITGARLRDVDEEGNLIEMVQQQPMEASCSKRMDVDASTSK